MRQLEHLAQVVADLHASATSDPQLHDRLGAVLARLETVADPAEGQARDGFDRDRILDTVAELADAADGHEATRPAASWLRGVLDACGRPAAGRQLDLGTDQTPYAAAPAEARGCQLRADIVGATPQDAPVALALALAAEQPELALTGVTAVARGPGSVTVAATVTGDSFPVGHQLVDTHVDLAGSRVGVKVTVAPPAG